MKKRVNKKMAMACILMTLGLPVCNGLWASGKITNGVIGTLQKQEHPKPVKDHNQTLDRDGNRIPKLDTIAENNGAVKAEYNVRCLSRYLRDDAWILDGLVFPTTNPTLADSIGYYLNMCIANGDISVDISKESDIDLLISELSRNLPERLSAVDTDTASINDFVATQLPAIYDSGNIDAAIDTVFDGKLISEDFNALYKAFVKGMCSKNGLPDITNYTGSLNVIRNSNLPPETKEALESAIILTYANVRLWDFSKLKRDKPINERVRR